MNNLPRRANKVCSSEPRRRPRVITKKVDLSFRRIGQFDGWRHQQVAPVYTGHVPAQWSSESLEHESLADADPSDWVWTSPTTRQEGLVISKKRTRECSQSEPEEELGIFIVDDDTIVNHNTTVCSDNVEDQIDSRHGATRGTYTQTDGIDTGDEHIRCIPMQQEHSYVREESFRDPQTQQYKTRDEATRGTQTEQNETETSNDYQKCEFDTSNEVTRSTQTQSEESVRGPQTLIYAIDTRDKTTRATQTQDDHTDTRLEPTSQSQITTVHVHQDKSVIQSSDRVISDDEELITDTNLIDIDEDSDGEEAELVSCADQMSVSDQSVGDWCTPRDPGKEPLLTVEEVHNHKEVGVVWPTDPEHQTRSRNDVCIRHNEDQLDVDDVELTPVENVSSESKLGISVIKRQTKEMIRKAKRPSRKFSASKSCKKFTAARNKKIKSTNLYGDLQPYKMIVDKSKPKEELQLTEVKSSSNAKLLEKKSTEQPDWNSSVNTSTAIVIHQLKRERRDCISTQGNTNLTQDNTRISRTEERILSGRRSKSLDAIHANVSRHVQEKKPTTKPLRHSRNGSMDLSKTCTMVDIPTRKKLKLNDNATKSDQNKQCSGVTIKDKTAEDQKYARRIPVVEGERVKRLQEKEIKLKKTRDSTPTTNCCASGQQKTKMCIGMNVPKQEDKPIPVGEECHLEDQKRVKRKPPVPVLTTEAQRQRSKMNQVVPKVKSFCKKLKRKPSTPRWTTEPFDTLSPWRRKYKVIRRAHLELPGLDQQLYTRLANLAVQDSGLNWNSDDYMNQLMMYNEKIAVTDANSETDVIPQNLTSYHRT